MARKILLEAHRYTGPDALKDGVVDALAAPDELYSTALEWANRWKDKAKADAYGILRGELVKPAIEFQCTKLCPFMANLKNSEDETVAIVENLK